MPIIVIVFLEFSVCDEFTLRPLSHLYQGWELWWLTDEDDQQQAGGVQLDAGVAEGVTEGGVDDH